MTTHLPRTIGALLAMLLVAATSGVGTAHAAEAPIGLGSAANFSVLGGSTVTNTGPSVLSDDLGLHPGTSITGFPPGIVNGTVHETDAVALQAQSDTTTAYNEIVSRTDTATMTVLGGQTLVSGVYSGSSLDLTGTVTLDAQGDPDAVFIFKSGSELTTASNSTVSLINGAQACNVFWQVTSSATLGEGTQFVGTLIALTSITAVTGANVEGRLLARNGAVTLDTNTITTPAPCVATAPDDDATAPDDDATAPDDDATAPDDDATPTADDDATATTGTPVPPSSLPDTGGPGVNLAVLGGLLLTVGVSLLLALRTGRSAMSTTQPSSRTSNSPERRHPSR